MNLLYRWVNEHEGWKPTTLEREKEYISSFYPDLEETKKRLIEGEIVACSIKIFKLNDGSA